MTIRKRRQPTPGFRLPPPYQPITGERASLVTPGVFPYAAMMQVAAKDTHQDYVICRGVDVRTNRFIDYEAGDNDKPGIAVAKPFGRRHTGAYQIGQVFPAILPLQNNTAAPASVSWRVGQNPGVASTTAGHPADLNEAIELLSDDDGTVINYQLLDTGPTLQRFCLAEDHPGRGVVFDVYRGTWDSSTHAWTFDTGSTINAIDWFYGASSPTAGARCWGIERPSDSYGIIIEVLEVDCTSPGACA